LFFDTLIHSCRKEWQHPPWVKIQTAGWGKFQAAPTFLFSAIMQCAGLDRRIALGLLDKVKVKTVNGVIWTMFGVNLVLSFVVPAANARAATLLPVINGLTRLFGDTEQERNAEKAIAIQSLVYGSMISGMCILTAHLPNLVITGLFISELHIRISYPSRTASNMAKKFAGGTGRPILSFAATPMATPTASRSMSATCATARSGSKAGRSQEPSATPICCKVPQCRETTSI
jgi:hypothetical protein